MYHLTASVNRILRFLDRNLPHVHHFSFKWRLLLAFLARGCWRRKFYTRRRLLAEASETRFDISSEDTHPKISLVSRRGFHSLFFLSWQGTEGAPRKESCTITPDEGTLLSDAYLRAKRRKLRSGTVSTCLLSPRQTTKFPKKQVRGRLRRAATIADAVTVTKKTLLRSLVYSFVDFCQSPPYLNMSVEVSGRLAYRRVVHGCGVVGLLLDFAHARACRYARV